MPCRSLGISPMTCMLVVSATYSSMAGVNGPCKKGWSLSGARVDLKLRSICCMVCPGSVDFHGAAAHQLAIPFAAVLYLGAELGGGVAHHRVTHVGQFLAHRRGLQGFGERVAQFVKHRLWGALGGHVTHPPIGVEIDARFSERGDLWQGGGPFCARDREREDLP